MSRADNRFTVAFLFAGSNTFHGASGYPSTVVGEILVVAEVRFLRFLAGFSCLSRVSEFHPHVSQTFSRASQNGEPRDGALGQAKSELLAG